MKISKHIEIVVNLGNYENIKLSVEVEDEVQTDVESPAEASARIRSNVLMMLASDIVVTLAENQIAKERALLMINTTDMDGVGDNYPEDDYDGDFDDED